MASLFDGVAWFRCSTAYSLCIWFEWVVSSLFCGVFDGVFASWLLRCVSGSLRYFRMSFDSHSARIAGAAQPTRPTLCLGWRSCTDPGHQSLIHLMIPRSHPNACAALLAPPYFRTGTLNRHAARVGSRRPAATAATMMCLDKRNGTSEPASRATQRCCGLFSWSCRPDLATARRAGWSHAQETGIVRRRAGPLPSALGRVQKTRGGPFGTLHKIGALCRRGWSHFGVTQSHDTASFWPKRSGISTAAALRHRSETETNEQRCCRLKSCCIQFCMALRRSIRCDRRC